MSEYSTFSNPDINRGRTPDPEGHAGPASGGPPAVSRGAADVFSYEDYRAYMRDRFAELQARNQTFSQRGLARKARIANPGFFNEVIRGRRRLSPAAAAKMAYGLDLSPLETAYFSALVDYTEARDTAAKLKAGKRMVMLKNRKLYHAIQETQSPNETLRRILQELERDWVLQGAGLCVEQADQEGLEPMLDPVFDTMSESTFSRILEKLICLRAQTESAPQAVQFSLLVAPRASASPS
jgi:hypothetical protein